MTMSGLEQQLREAGRGGQAAEDGTRAGTRLRRLRNFLFNVTDQPHSDELLNEVFDLVVPWLDRERRVPKSELADTGYVGQIESRGWFDYFPKPEGAAAAPADPDGAAAAMAGELAGALTLGFDIALRDFSDAALQLTGRKRCANAEPALTDKAGFVTYRYSTAAGNIIRTFTVVTPPSANFPFCWFRNFYRYGDRRLERDCSGIAVRMGHVIVLLGILPPRDGIKLMLLPTSAGQAGLLSGLIATADNAGAPLMARVALERVDATKLEDLPAQSRPGVLRYGSSASKRIGGEIVQRIRNHIAFEAGTEIVWHTPQGDVPVPAWQMSKEVERMCSGTFSRGGKPFNPAAHAHYPFNQALTMFAALETAAEES